MKKGFIENYTLRMASHMWQASGGSIHLEEEFITARLMESLLSRSEDKSSSLSASTRIHLTRSGRLKISTFPYSELFSAEVDSPSLQSKLLRGTTARSIIPDDHTL